MDYKTSCVLHSSICSFRETAETERVKNGDAEATEAALRQRAQVRQGQGLA